MDVFSVYKRCKVKQKDGKLYDPVRKKYVRAIPEEYVRHKTIRFLMDYLDVPSEKIVVERSLGTLGVEGDRRRIDIGIPDAEDNLMVIAICKYYPAGRSEHAFIQAQDYLADLHAKYFFVTDGMIFTGYRYRYMHFEQMEEIPKYHELAAVKL